MNWLTLILLVYLTMYPELHRLYSIRQTLRSYCILIQFHALQIFVDCILKPQEGEYNRILKWLVSLSIELHFGEIKYWIWKYVPQSSQNQVAVESQDVRWNVLFTLCWSNGHALRFKKLVMVVVYYYCDQQHLVGIQSNCCLLH